jgi:hypothetical protein
MTNQTYDAFLLRIADDYPNHPLLSTLRKGTSLLNQRRILTVIQQINDLEKDEAITDEDDEDDLEEQLTPSDTDDEVLKKMYIQKSNLFVIRAKHSNELHECETDQQRAKVVEKIVAIQVQIEAHLQRMSAYKKNGKMHDDDDEFQIPVDPVKLVKKLNSVRANISITTKKITELYHIETKTEDQKKQLDKHDKNLKKLEVYKKMLENEVKKHDLENVHG